MKENIINNKEKILDTKILLEMRIDLENIYEIWWRNFIKL